MVSTSSVNATRDTEGAQMAIKALRHGADDYLCKPFDGAAFPAALDRTISRLTPGRTRRCGGT